MIDLKLLKVESLVPLVFLGLALLVVIGVVNIALEVILGIGFFNVFGSVTLTDTLLFLILLTQVSNIGNQKTKAKGKK